MSMNSIHDITKIEKAVCVDHITQKIIRTINVDSYQRIYFGNEFCGRKLFDEQALSGIIDFCLQNNLKLTLTLPFVTEPQLTILKPLLRRINECDCKAALDLEITVNDWGVFHYIKEHDIDVKLNMGRLLTQQKKDHNYAFIKGLDPADPFFSDSIFHVQSTIVDSNPIIHSFIHDNFDAVELENTIQGIDIETSSPIHLFYPMVAIATTRYCLYASHEIGSHNATQYIPCKKSCNKEYMINNIDDVKLFLAGNTQFYINNELPGDLSRIDRLIYNDFTEFY